MNGYILFDTRSGAHIVSHALTKRFGMTNGPEVDSDTQAHSIAGMLFGLLIGAQEAMGGAHVEAEPNNDSDHPTESLLRRLEAAGIDVGHPDADRSPNVAYVERLTLGETVLHVFQHAYFPIAAVAVFASFSAELNGAEATLGRHRIGALVAESLGKAFAHHFGLDCIEASHRGVAKPFRKAFSPHAARCFLECAASSCATLCGISTSNLLNVLPSEGLLLALASSRAEAGRWVLAGEVTSLGAHWSVTFSSWEFSPPHISERLKAFDAYLEDLTADWDAAGAVHAAPDNARIEVQGAANESFSIMQVPGLDCVAVSTLRLVTLEKNLLCSDGTASELVRVTRSLIHAIAKLRSSGDPARHVLKLDEGSPV